MKLIEKFHKMELDFKLFELGSEINFPIWDIVRYQIFREYLYPKEDAKRFFIPKKHPALHFLILFLAFINFVVKYIFNYRKILILTSSRYKNEKGEYYDKSALPIIESAGEKAVIMEAILNKKIAYNYIYDFKDVFSRLYKSKKVSNEYYEIISKAVITALDEQKFSKELFESILHDYSSACAYYNLILKFKKFNKIFILPGNPKAEILVAKRLKMQSYLVQHASIEVDEIDYSYPIGITKDSNILFPDFVLTLGDYWCKNLNVPATEIIPIGNGLYFNSPVLVSDNSILVISTIVHGKELSKLTQEVALMHTDLQFVYKLHPNEYHYAEEYKELFKDCSNVVVLTTEKDTSELIAKSRLVILIVSAILYEALNQNKKVAIYMKVNFERQLIFESSPNVYFFNYSDEVINILGKQLHPTSVSFYKQTDKKKIEQLLQ